MTDSQLRPTDEAGVVEIVTAARAHSTPLELVGGGSKRALGRPAQAASTLSLAELKGITRYKPAELFISAKAGTPVAEVEAALADKGQRLPFEPIDYRPLLGTDDTEPTIGGVVACNLSGPARVNAGAARDLLIGIRAVNGRGEAIHSGGTVMKNVTGYDLCKIMAGAHGTLGVLTEVTFKVLPQPERVATVLVFGLEAEDGRDLLSKGLGSPFEVMGAAHLPAAAAAHSTVPAVAQAGASVTALRLEGFAPSIAYRQDAMRDHLDTAAGITVLDTDASAVLWREIRDVAALLTPGDRPVWRLSVAPSHGPGVAAGIGAALPASVLFDWGCGLLWVAPDVPAGSSGAEVIRPMVQAVGGHATLIRASETVRAAEPVFEPQPAPLAALTARIKDAFDPAGLLNPGKMVAGM